MPDRPRHSGTAIDAVRRFSRAWNRRLGMLAPELPDGELGLADARLLVEVAQYEPVGGGELAQALSLDPGHVSRVLSRLEARGLLRRRRVAQDARRRVFSLSAAGRRTHRALDRASRDRAGELLDEIGEDARDRVVAAMNLVRRHIAGPAVPPMVVLRESQPGDMGWVISRHGALYSEEFGWDASFEGVVARIGADIIENFDPVSDRGFVAEVDGARAGSAWLVRADGDTAKLRLVLVEPAARGLGLGRRLVQECLGFARRAGYRRVVLWTVDTLTAARHIYQSEGFRLESSVPAPAFGQALVDEVWSLDLD